MKLLELINTGKLCIRVVSLRNDIERRNKIQELLSNFKFEFLDAIDGRLMKARDFFKLSSTSKSRFLSPAELGCSLSHQEAYIEFLNSDFDYLMVLEDDVVFNDFSFFEIDINENINDLLLILGGQDGLRRPKFLRNVRLNKKGLYIHSFYGKLFQRTCCYMISKDRASELTSLWNKGAFLADDWYYILKNTKFKGVLYLPIFSHPIDLSTSIIEEERLLIGKKQ